MKKIYLIQQEETNLFKIGISKNPEKRIKDLQIGSGIKLTLIHTFETKFSYKLESSLHAYYRSKLIQPEWFVFTIEDKDNFLCVCDKLENNLKVLEQYNNPFI